jgi:hypothetical protein
MINQTAILTSFNQLVGYKDQQGQTLSAGLKVSNSGLYVNDLSGVDLESVNKSIFIKTDLTQEKTVSTYLSDIYNAEVIKLVNKVIHKSKNLLHNKEVFKFIDTVQDVYYQEAAQKGDFVGYLIELNNSITINCAISQLQLQLKLADNVRIYLYELSKKTAIATYDFDYNTTFDKLSKDVSTFILEYQNEYGSGLTYLIGFYEYNSVNPQAVQLSQNNAIYEYRTNILPKIKDFAYIIPVRIDKQYHNYSTDYQCPTITENNLCFNHSNSYIGSLGLRLSLVSDYSDIVIKYVSYFAEALQYSLALRIINDCIFTKNFNQVTESQINNWKNIAIFLENKLNGYDFTTSEGRGHYNGLIETLIQDLEGVDSMVFKQRKSSLYV